MNLEDFLTKVALIDGSKRDVITDTHYIQYHAGRKVSFDGTGTQYKMTDTACEQLASKLEIPYKYFRKLDSENGELLAQNINYLTSKDNGQTMIRCIQDHTVRAVLSTKYKPIDNMPILSVLKSTLDGSPIKDNIKVERAFVDNEGRYMSIMFTDMTKTASIANAEDKVVSGFCIKNSETGEAAFEILPYVFRQVCTNGLIRKVASLKDKIRYVHLGKSSTNRLQIVHAINYAYASFNDTVGCLQYANKQAVELPKDMIINLSKLYQVSDNTIQKVIWAYDEEPMPNLYGIVNAFTRAAHDFDGKNRDELEDIGGKILSLNVSKYDHIAKVKGDN